MTATPPVPSFAKTSAPSGSILSQALHDSRVRLGLFLLIVFGCVALLAPVLAPYDPQERLRNAAGQLARLSAPSLDHPMGTTNFGRDIFSQLVWGTRRTLGVGAAAAFMAVFIGTNIGLVAGYLGGRVDDLLMRVTDATYALPFLPFAIVLVGMAGRSNVIIIVAIALLFWRTTARVVRSRVLSLKERTFVKTAKIGGATRVRTLYMHIAPNVLSLTSLYAVLLTAEAVMAEASLSFLGFAPPESLSWGTIMFDAFTSQEIREAWWWPLFPGVALMGFISSVSLLGRGLEGVLNPKISGGDLLVWQGEGSREINSPTDSDPTSLLDVENLRVVYNPEAPVSVTAVKGVDLTIQPGEMVGLVGESGSGKTTLARAILGLLPPSASVTGAVRYQGLDLLTMNSGRMRSYRWEEIAFVPQSAMNSLDPAHHVDDQIIEAILAHRKVTKAEAVQLTRDALRSVGINPDRGRDFPHQFSGGMRQRALIAMAVVLQPQLLVADEPTTGLDVIVQSEIIDQLNRIRDESGVAVIMVSHDLALVAESCSKLFVMHNGDIVDAGETNAIIAEPSHPYTVGLLDVARQRGEALQGQRTLVSRK